MLGFGALSGTPLAAEGAAALATPDLTVSVAGVAIVAHSAAGGVVGIIEATSAEVSAVGLAVVAHAAVGAAIVIVSGEFRLITAYYCTQADLVDRFGQVELIQLTNPTDPAAVTVNATRADDGIADIDALIDAKLQARYTLPLAAVPRVLRNIACDLVRARLYEDRITDHVAKRETAALKLLDEIAQGKLQLGLDDAGQAAPSSDGPQFTTGTRVFSSKLLGDYA